MLFSGTERKSSVSWFPLIKRLIFRFKQVIRLQRAIKKPFEISEQRIGNVVFRYSKAISHTSLATFLADSTSSTFTNPKRQRPSQIPPTSWCGIASESVCYKLFSYRLARMLNVSLESKCDTQGAIRVEKKAFNWKGVLLSYIKPILAIYTLSDCRP